MRIIHVFRSPLGGLFRHVRDVVRGQSALGHDVGLLCDSSTGGEGAERALADLQPMCSLGVRRMPISTFPTLADIKVSKALSDWSRQARVDVLHGHGAKGGVYARLVAHRLDIRGLYTPHGGSLHYDWLKPPGTFFLAAEKAFRLKGTGMLFVCEFERNLYARKIGLSGYPSKVVYNGLWPEEFATRQLIPGATDFLFVGEMRMLKGVDVLLRALAAFDEGNRPSLTLVGDGRDQDAFETLSQSLGLSAHVHFAGRRPMQEAMKMGRVLVMPSRHESFPYVVLEAMAAQIPIIASNIGGIAEALPAPCLVPPEDVASLKTAMERASQVEEATKLAEKLQESARQNYSASGMVDGICAFYDALH